MKIAQKSLYAISALLHIAEFGQDGQRFSVADIAKACGSPTPFLHLIFRTLKNGGLVESQRGKGGGYILARTPESITVEDVFSCVEGADALSLVGDDSEAQPPVIAALCHDAEAAMRKVFASSSLADLVVRARTLREAESIGYNI